MLGKLYPVIAGSLTARMMGFSASKHRHARRVRFVHKHPDGRGHRAAARAMERARATFRQQLQHPGRVSHRSVSPLLVLPGR